MFCSGMLCHALFCHAMLRYALSCYAMLCYVLLISVMLVEGAEGGTLGILGGPGDLAAAVCRVGGAGRSVLEI